MPADARPSPARPPRLPASIEFLERDWLSSNMVLLTDPDHATLVDSGYAKSAPMTVALVNQRLLAHGLPLHRLINTHLHSDHCGGNAALAAATGCAIQVPVASAAAVADWDEDALSYRPTAQRCGRFTAQATLGPGDPLHMGGADWEVLSAPGHDPNALILHCPEHRLLISADALWGNGFGVIFPELEGESGFDEQGSVLDLIATLDVDTVIPGHGPMFGDVGAALERAYARLASLRADPTRNARHALKVMVKFLLLDLERITLEGLIAHTGEASVLRSAAGMLGLTLPQAIRASVEELVAQKALFVDGDVLHN
jgi:glyoxylase-like metal-dependent hydrolase (beta-lactamase superfamily II)